MFRVIPMGFHMIRIPRCGMSTFSRSLFLLFALPSARFISNHPHSQFAWGVIVCKIYQKVFHSLIASLTSLYTPYVNIFYVHFRLVIIIVA